MRARRTAKANLFNARLRKRIPVTVHLSPQAFEILELLVAIEDAPNYRQERAIERALRLLNSHLEVFLEQVNDGARQGRDPIALGNRLKPDFVFREEQ